jgi:hypothetical protein
MRNKGVDFLIGLVVIYVAFRMVAGGYLNDFALMATSEGYVGNPFAIITALVFEAVIAIGTATSLVMTGVWSAAVSGIEIFADASKTWVEYLREQTASMRDSRKSQPKAKDDIKFVPQPPVEKPKSDVEMLMLAIKDTRERQQDFEAKVDRRFDAILDNSERIEAAIAGIAATVAQLNSKEVAA